MDAPAWNGEPGSRFGDRNVGDHDNSKPPPKGVLVDGWCQWCQRKVGSGSTVCPQCRKDKSSRVSGH